MKKVGIICEYNPFHTGHLHQINEIKKGGDTAVICLMSGNATQRGELAITDKYTRAACALECGADLVLELPFPFSCASADYFAAAGVVVLDALGVDEINFGSESADAEKLRKTAELTFGSDFDQAYRKKQESSPKLGSAQAYFATLADFGVDSELMSNDILAISYFKAAMRAKCDAKLALTKRDGSAYNDKNVSGGKHPSATALRLMIKQGDGSAFDLMPISAADIMRSAQIADTERLTVAILSFFRLADGDSLSRFAETGGGLSHRLCSAAREAVSLSDFFERAAAKRYTDSRVRRAVLNCMIGVTPDDLRTPPAYIQLLAANTTGRSLIAEIKKASALPLVTKPADAPECRQAELSLRLDALYTLAFSDPKPAAEYIKRAPIIDFQEKD